MSEHDPAIEHLLRVETPKVLGALVRRFGRFDVAEDAVQEALLAAAQQWPDAGVPDDPHTWLIRVGYRRMVDHLRSEHARHRRELEAGVEEIFTPRAPGANVDDSLTLLRLCCHPTLSPATRVALTLRAVGGLTTAEISHAYGVAEASMGTRISRAKQQLRAAGTRFVISNEADHAERMRSVQHVLYLIFNEGYTASAGEELGRVDLATEAIRLTRMLVHAAPDEAEASGLLALMLLTEARRPARTGSTHDLVPLAEQQRTRWDQDMLAEGITLIDETWAQGRRGPYQIQAAIAALHGRAASIATTDWHQIVGLYLMLEQHTPTAPVRLGRIVAASHAFGPAAGLELLAALDADYDLTGDPLTRQRVPAVRAHLLDQCGNRAAAAAAFRAAAGLTENAVERDYLLARAAQADER